MDQNSVISNNHSRAESHRASQSSRGDQQYNDGSPGDSVYPNENEGVKGEVSRL